jgi:Ca-activated chloride channel homolog
MNQYILLTLATFIIAFNAFGQSERSEIRQGNREYKKSDYLNSEISYRSAIEKNPSSVKGNFNLGGALFKQDKLDDAKQSFEEIASSNADAKIRAKAFHNLGNTLYKQQKLKEAADAYKSSLRLNPNDEETKYNLSEVLRMLKQQQNQQNDKGDNNDKKDDKDNDKKDDKNDDKKDDKKDNNKDDKQDQDKKEQQQQEQKISPEDARRMLEAIQKNEKDVQQKVLEQQAKQAKVKVDKNW